ncbi:MAG TPA: hypothetical protein VOA88_01150 [Candidatus Dormibacteraeota bacterium]|nr:hypothetical protein [Candidatus Dormibacteraeota bacterium]
MSKPKTYLGDGCYADIIAGNLILTTEDGSRTTNRVVLEPEVLSALLSYLGFPKPEDKS